MAGTPISFVSVALILLVFALGAMALDFYEKRWQFRVRGYMTGSAGRLGRWYIGMFNGSYYWLTPRKHKFTFWWMLCPILADFDTPTHRVDESKVAELREKRRQGWRMDWEAHWNRALQPRFQSGNTEQFTPVWSIAPQSADLFGNVPERSSKSPLSEPALVLVPHEEE